MIESTRLVTDLKKQLKVLEADLAERANDPEVPWHSEFLAEYESAFTRERTALSWSDWSKGELSQAAVAWIVASTFIRFSEDNDLLVGASVEGVSSPAPWIAGPGDRLDRAVENQSAFFSARPTLTARDWLIQPFLALSGLPAGRGLVDPTHSQVWRITISAEAADRFIQFWRATNADGTLVHDFKDSDLSTRFLGDLYQDLSDYAKKTYALLQTPIFVEEFILDRTLTPAIEEFGLEGLKLIDPTCGSGHFLLGAFDRLNEAWAAKAPAMDDRSRVQKALDSVHGVDLNPFAAAIARFRLTVAALQAAGETSLVSAPKFGLQIAVGDSLLRWTASDVQLDLGGGEETFAYSTEDIREFDGILTPGQYHVVVGNPPYIQVKDKALNEAYRRLYATCSGKYALSVPFMELFFELAVGGSATSGAGYVGKITSNSFMKREFGKKVIEQFLSGWDEFGSPVDLTAVVDTSGAYIPGHGTPTVILFGRRRRKQGGSVRAALGVRGEPGQPDDPANGLVWRDIVDHLDQPGYSGTYVTIADLPRESLAHHPWSLAGGGAGELKETLDENGERSLPARAYRVGVFGIMGSDDAFMTTEAVARRYGKVGGFRPLVVGDAIRDYSIHNADPTFFPYNSEHELQDLGRYPLWSRQLWALRTELGNRATFSRGTYFSDGRPWYEWHQLPKDFEAHPWTITFAFVATHNHFVLDRGGKVFKQSAPVIKLPADATEDDHLELLGVLNSSVACFWLKQVSYPKGGDPMGDSGARVSVDPWSDRYEFTSTKLEQYPLPRGGTPSRARSLDKLALLWRAQEPCSVLDDLLSGRVSKDQALAKWESTLRRMVAEQEELDWDVYANYGLVGEEVVGHAEPEQLAPEERPFEIVLGRSVIAGASSNAWFSRHSRNMVASVPSSWSPDRRALFERRITLIETDANIRLLEQPAYKRRWATPSWESLLAEALTSFVLDRLESPGFWIGAHGAPETRSVAQLADEIRGDQELREALRLLTGDDGVNIQAAITRVLKDEAVPAASALRLKATGLPKFREWQRVWDLQRAEDRGERVSTPVPPKYAPADFVKASYWRARGKLDVPKERFISYPGASRGSDDSAVYGWAGWDHAEQARALSGLLIEMSGAGASTEQLMPLLAALIELEPWVIQWHSDPDPSGIVPAAAITGIFDSQLARLGKTRSDARDWVPTPSSTTRGRPAASTIPKDLP